MQMKSRSTWACELKWPYRHTGECPHQSRSTWACELKFVCFLSLHGRSSHAPRERVSWNVINRGLTVADLGHAPRERVSWNAVEHRRTQCWASRSTWACELKSEEERCEDDHSGHAPRERVSWNLKLDPTNVEYTVTLHVSVWVEINQMLVSDYLNSVTLHVSVWVEIDNAVPFLQAHYVTLHVSVWVEISNGRWDQENSVSRSTWACELKCEYASAVMLQGSHAPRERVSWNLPQLIRWVEATCHAPRERVSWNS